MADVVLSLGSNIGDRQHYLRRMETETERLLASPVKKSSLMETGHVGAGSAPPYLNRLIRGNYRGSAGELLRECQSIEKELGRERPFAGAPRTADIDILLFGDEEVCRDDLVIPHPKILERRFCMAGLAEIAGEKTLPGSPHTFAELAKTMDAVVAAQEVRIIPPADRQTGESMELKEPGASLHFNFLAIEGVIGAGKTSLCRLLAESWDAALILEEVDENPFLTRFYRERDVYAFQTQLWFLLSRYRQLSESGGQQDLFHAVTISDYLFAKDRIFASLNLDGNELQMYNTVAAALEPKVPTPDLVVYLQASTDTLLRRIEMRSRACETGIEPEYIEALNSAYNHFFFHYDKTPLLVINTDELDFIEQQTDLEEITRQIMELKRGVLYYKPLKKKEKAALRGHAAESAAPPDTDEE